MQRQLPRQLPRTRTEVLERFLGAPVGVTVSVDEVEYVLPLGVDPYWQDFGVCFGYELLSDERERPVQVGPTQEIWRPGRPRPGYVAGRRRTWIDLPPAPELVEARLPWEALGDLRRCLRWAVTKKHLLMPEQAWDGAEWLVGLLRSAQALELEISRSRRLWPSGEASEPSNGEESQLSNTAGIFEGLSVAQGALAALVESVFSVANDAEATDRHRRLAGLDPSEVVAEGGTAETLSVLGAAGVPPPPYPRPAGGRPPEPLLAVHAADHYFREFSSFDLTPQDLAMVAALEDGLKFGATDAGTSFLAGTSGDRNRAIRYWKDRIRDYNAPTKFG